MPDDLPPAVPEDGKLSHNIIWFARALRKAGLPLGTGRVIDAIRAVEAAGFTRKADFYWTLQACFVSRPEHRVVFDQIFRLFWRDPRYLEQMMALLTPLVQGGPQDRPAAPAEMRAAQALLDGQERPAPQDEPEAETEIEIDASRTASADERLQTLDFEQMSVAEMAEARRVLAGLTLPVPPCLTRRTRPRPGGMADWRGTLRAAVRAGGEIRLPQTRRYRDRMPNLVVLCDISGSMSAYSRAVLQFVHAVANARGQGWARVHAFTFGTRLTNISRHLAARDVDEALAAAGAEAQDWSGGTRIATAIAAFNRDWSRRVLGPGAVVLLITDGLDRDPEGDLGAAMARLALSSGQVIWLNPLLRWEEFAPRARGVAEILPHVTSFRAGHNIAALSGLAEALARPGDAGEKARMMAMLRRDGIGAGPG